MLLWETKWNSKYKNEQHSFAKINSQFKVHVPNCLIFFTEESDNLQFNCVVFLQESCNYIQIPQHQGLRILSWNLTRLTWDIFNFRVVDFNLYSANPNWLQSKLKNGWINHLTRLRMGLKIQLGWRSKLSWKYCALFLIKYRLGSSDSAQRVFSINLSKSFARAKISEHLFLCFSWFFWYAKSISNI